MTSHSWNLAISVLYPVMAAFYFIWWLQLARIIIRDPHWFEGLKPRLWWLWKIPLIRFDVPGRKVVALLLFASWVNLLDIWRLRIQPSETEFLWHNSASNGYIFLLRLWWAIALLWTFNRWRKGDILSAKSSPKAGGDTAARVSPETPAPN